MRRRSQSASRRSPSAHYTRFTLSGARLINLTHFQCQEAVGMVGGNGVMVLGPRIHGCLESSSFNACYTRPGEQNSQAQPETAAAARGRRREYPVVLPSVASGSCLASWRLVLGIANCRMITTLCPLEAVARSRRSPAVLTVNQRRRTINRCCVKIARTLPSFYQTVP